MDFSKNKQIIDIITTKEKIYIITTNKKHTPTIITEKTTTTIETKELLTHPELNNILTGTSIKTKKQLYKQETIYTYNLKKQTTTKKQTISHQLQGTGGRKSLLKKLEGKKLGKGTINIPTTNEKQLETYLNTNNIEYNKKRILTRGEQK